MGPEILSLRGGFPFLPGPLERSFTVHTFWRNWARKPPLFSFWSLSLSQMVCILIESKKWLSNAKDFWVLCNRLEVRSRIKSSILVDLVDFINVSQISKTQTAAFSSNMGNICSGGNIGHGWLSILAFKGMIFLANLIYSRNKATLYEGVSVCPSFLPSVLPSVHPSVHDAFSFWPSRSNIYHVYALVR